MDAIRFAFSSRFCSSAFHHSAHHGSTWPKHHPNRTASSYLQLEHSGLKWSLQSSNWNNSMAQMQASQYTSQSRGRIVDVSSAKNVYGPGGSYSIFAGKDATRALAKMSKNEEDVCCSLDGLSEKEMRVLNDWEKKFEAKYPAVGRVA